MKKRAKVIIQMKDGKLVIIPKEGLGKRIYDEIRSIKLLRINNAGNNGQMVKKREDEDS